MKGMIILGQVKQGAGLADMQITTKLLNVIQKNDFSCPLHGATIALSIIYIKTNQSRVSEKLAIPDTMHELDRIPPDLVLLRVIARNMIHWDDMEASTEWVEKQIPAILRESGNQTLSVIPMYYSVLSGVCFSLGLRFAGSANNAAFTTLLAFYENISRNLTKGVSYGDLLEIF